MDSYQKIQHKLQDFMQKFYTNELIKGIILFFSLGLLYFIITLFIEYFLWLSTTYRTLLFWLFIAVELFLFLVYIAFPISKLIGLKKGISQAEAAKIIGNYFPEVSDKLLNVLQLHQITENSDLLTASINQKVQELQPVPFKKAIHFSANKKYLKYAILPIFLILFIYFSGSASPFQKSFSRVLNYTEAYEPPAPFHFVIQNDLEVVEGENILIKVKIEGNTVPKNIKMVKENEVFYLQNKSHTQFEYQLFNVDKSQHFYLEAEGITSKKYEIKVVKKPMITELLMELNYPKYTRKKSEIITNTGNAVLPKGTNVVWKIKATETQKIAFVNNKKEQLFKQKENTFKFNKNIYKNLNYSILTSNSNLKNYESLAFSFQVINDEFPKIQVTTNIDSISRGPIQFAGRITDDYGISKLQLVYFDKKNPTDKKRQNISFSKGTFSDFYYIFPEGIELQKGVDYNFYFEVFDNDAIDGAKSAKTQIFNYYKATDIEVKENLLKEQKESIESISKSLEKSKKQQKRGDELQKSLLQKEKMNWNDKQKIKDFLKRQENYKKMMKRQSQKLKENIEEQSSSKKMEDKKKELLKRIEETKKLAEEKKILKELEELSKKMDKDKMFEKLKKLSSQSKRNEMTLKRILELTKRFYVEQKANQISEKLEELSKKQNKLSQQKDLNNQEKAKKQEAINKDFNEVKKELNNLKKDNKDLKRPMDLPNSSEKTKDIEKSLKKASENLKSGDSKSAKKNQKEGAKQMKQLSKMLQSAMDLGEMEQIDENIEDLQKILKNLLIFSFEQEDVMKRFSKITADSPQFSKYLKKQNTLKRHFEHIDDSLYVLSLRMVKMTNFIQKEVGNVHYSIENSLTQFPEGYIYRGVSSQRFALTSANNLADMLSDILQGLQNASPKFGMGKGKGKSQMPMPDIIKKHSQMLQKMKSGKSKSKGQKGKEKGKNGEKKESENGELYEIYKQQQQLKEALGQLLKNAKEGKGKQGGKKVMKKMDELQKELLKKGITDELLKKQIQLNYQLLKLEKASFKQGEDTKRKSREATQKFSREPIKKLKFKKDKLGYDEILQRQSLPLQTIYRQKVQNYFKQNK